MSGRLIISVVIDSYNYAAYIEKAIDSVLAQTIPHDWLEIIVVDDGSQDETARLVKAYGDLVIYHRKENGGQGSAFNRGVSLAQGEYIAFLDADDYFYPTKLAQVLKVFDSDRTVGIVFNRYDMVDEHMQKLCVQTPNLLLAGNLKSRVLMGYISGAPSSGICIRKEIVEKITIPEAPFRISADYFYLSIVPLITNVGVVETPEHAYRIHTNNLYSRKESDENKTMHMMQNAVIFAVAEKMGFSFFKGMHDLNYSPEAKTVYGRISILMKGLVWLLNHDGERRLRIRSLVKLMARFILPGQLYRRFQ